MKATRLVHRTISTSDVAPSRGRASATMGAGARVVLYTSSDCWRGAGVSYVAIADALDAHGFRPLVVATDNNVAEEFTASGLPAHLMFGGRGESWRLRRQLRSLGADAVLVDRAHDLRVATLATVGTTTPVIFRYNHFRDRAPSDAMIRVAFRSTLREQVFLSSSARQRVLGETPFMRKVPSTTIHEGIDATTFRPSRAAAAEFRRAHGLVGPFLLAVGALTPEKEYDLLFDALRILPNRPPLVILGEGPKERHLRERALQLRLDVRFFGRLPRSEVIGAYSAATAMVHAGSVETFGLAVLEAMACACPVIATAGGALPEVIGRDGSCGALVALRSAWDFAAVIRRVLEDPDAASTMGARARVRARTHFSLDAMQTAYARLVARHTGYRFPVASD